MTIHVKRYAIQKQFLILQLLEDIVDWALFTLSTICFIKANLGHRLSSKTRIMLSSNLSLKWCKSVHLVHSWVSDQRKLIRIHTKHLYHTVICWLTCHHEQSIDYVIAPTTDPFLQIFISRTDRNSQIFCTMNTQKLSTPQVFQSFSHKCESFSCSLAHKFLSGPSAYV